MERWLALRQHHVNEVEVTSMVSFLGYRGTDANPLPSSCLQRLTRPWLLIGE